MIHLPKQPFMTSLKDIYWILRFFPLLFNVSILFGFFFCCFFNAHRKSHICSLSRTLLKALQKRFFYSLPKAETVLLDSFSVAMAMEQFNQPTCSKTHLHLSLLSFLSRNLPKSLWRRCDFAPLHRTPHMPRFIALLDRGKRATSFFSFNLLNFLGLTGFSSVQFSVKCRCNAQAHDSKCKFEWYGGLLPYSWFEGCKHPSPVFYISSAVFACL